ncbi:competence/damage-inducible protein A [Gillisia sp. M10.2A]|uniref:CinA-like protein n=1 Tax=Gillisia lutea TaxID=2909668 RepID=A0ABS9EDR4_9FLAO|nr:competence/damage-inducible protein A [Gillisia lutea]MCF4101012.1 competence/damage-inducible protein A [Gillisia lutea]
MIAEIITIGDEILIGQIVDTNSAYIAKELNKIGVSVHQITSIEDEKDHILESLKNASNTANVVIITGGLGPTNDDVTKRTLCEYFEDQLILNSDVLEHIEEIFKRIKHTPISNLNREQAMVPSKAAVLHNKYGTAPGLWFKKDEVVYIAMPGVPFEMKALMEIEVLPKLKKEFDRPFIHHKTIRTYGLGESAIALRLEEWERNLPHHIKLAYLPNFGMVRLRLSGKGYDEGELKTSIELEFEKIYPLLKDIIADTAGEDEELSLSLQNAFIDKKSTLAVAESCTGGLLAAEITSNAGSSQFFKGGMVSYATQVKEEVLKVSKATVKKYSVVSRQVAEEMAVSARQLFKSDYAISTTGNAGPEKGESDAEVGTVYIGIATPEKVYAEKFELGKRREQVVKKAVNKALEMIYKELVTR